MKNKKGERKIFRTMEIINQINRQNKIGMKKEDLEASKIGLLCDIALSLSEIVDSIRSERGDDE